MNEETVEVGDVLRVSCAFAPTRVVEVSDREVSVVWPWERIDPDSEVRWNGQYAVPRRQGSAESRLSLFQTEPAPWTLSAGDSCGVGIPEQLVQVIDVGHGDPPHDVGWLPRPHTMLIVLPVDYEDPLGLAEGDTISVPSVAPVRFERVQQHPRLRY
ncbi:hypothetical protein ACFYX5_11230 [Streptomyces rubiginosohelvolus]|uniref:hypothetical protein n=1 Tax=Streptomyces rubiginosohelvolus TaxID=67362 RepID=UPI0036CE9460